MRTRHFSLLICIWILSIILISQGSCKKDDPDPNPEPEVPETTKIILSQDWNANITAIDSNTWTLTSIPELVQKYDLQVGDILICTKGQGLLRKITSIQEGNGNLLISTEEGTIVEAMPKGKLEFNIDLTQNLKDAKITYMAKGVQVKNMGKGRQNRIELVFSLEKELDDHLSISGELSIAPSISGRVVWNGQTPDTIRMQYTIKENLEILSTVDIMSLNLEKEVTLVTIVLPTITIYVGIPVLITPELSLKLGANVEVASEVTSGVNQELDFTAGFEYANGGIDPFCDMNMDLGPVPPQLSNTLEAKVYVKPQIDMRIYQVLSPNFSMQLYALLEAELGTSPWWTLYAGLSGSAGFEVGKWGFTVLDITADLFDYKVPVADATTPMNHPPEAAFTVDPPGGGIGTVFHFDASGCTDEEDPPENLQVRWDWENDGSWDTDFIYEKEMDHTYAVSGQYTVRLEVKDTEEATDKATQDLVVTGNHSPDAEFTVSPPFGTTTTEFLFDAGLSTDKEDPVEELQVRWDFDGNGVFETGFSFEKQVFYQYQTEGNFPVILEVKDSEGAFGQMTHEVIVQNSGTGEPCPGNPTVTDIDGNVYNTVLIGTQCWMKENLKTTNYRNGADIEYPGSDTGAWINNTAGAYAWYENDVSWKELYGALYNWYAVNNTNGLCPPGWHVSSDNEWTQLVLALSGGTNHGGNQLKSCRQVDSPLGEFCNTGDHPRWDADDETYGTDDYGFSALPGGERTMKVFASLGRMSVWWTATEYASLAYYRYLVYNHENVNKLGCPKNRGFSVRCVRDR